MNWEGRGTSAPPIIPAPPVSRELFQPPTLCSAGTYGLPLPTKPHKHPDKEDRMEMGEEKIRPCERQWKRLGGVGRAQRGDRVHTVGMCAPGLTAEPQGGWHVPGVGYIPMVGVRFLWWVAHHQAGSHVLWSVARP